MDLADVYKVVANGGPDVIFLLLLFLSLFLTGVLRVKREVDAQTEQVITMKGINDDLLERLDRQQALFERSLDLLERQLAVGQEAAPRRR